MNQDLMVFILDLDEYSDIGTHSVALYMKNNNNCYLFRFFWCRAYSKRN